MKTLSQKLLLRLVKNSSNVKLFTNIINQGHFNSDDIINITQNGIMGGFGGYVHYTETNQFYDANKSNILTLAYDCIDDCGYKGIGEFLSSFGCLKSYSATECEQALIVDTDDTIVVKNALAWFAAEEACRYIYDILDEKGRI